MPLPTVATQAGLLTPKAKINFTGDLTAFHAVYAGVPKNWVHIVLQDCALGSVSRQARWPQRWR